MANAVFNLFKRNLGARNFQSGVDLDTDDIKIILVTTLPNATAIDTWEDYADVTNELATGGGYTQGGVSLAGASSAVDTTNDRAEFDFTDPVWSTFTATGIVGALLYRNVSGVAANSPVIGFYDFGGTKNGGGGNFTVVFDAEGAIQIA